MAIKICSLLVGILFMEKFRLCLTKIRPLEKLKMLDMRFRHVSLLKETLLSHDSLWSFLRKIGQKIDKLKRAKIFLLLYYLGIMNGHNISKIVQTKFKSMFELSLRRKLVLAINSCKCSTKHNISSWKACGLNLNNLLVNLFC